MRILTLIALAMLWASLALARPIGIGVPAAPAERDALALTAEIGTLRAIHVLALTPAQLDTVKPILSAQVTEIMAIRKAKIEAQPAVEKAMTDLRTAVLANNGVSDDVKSGVRKAEAPFKGIEKKLEDAGPERAAQVWAVLTTAQGAQFRRLAGMRFQDDATVTKQLAGLLHPRLRDPDRALAMIYRAYGLRGEEISRASVIGKPVLQEWLVQPTAAQGQTSRENCVQRILALPAQGILDARPDSRTERALLDTLLTQKALHYLDPTVPMPPTEHIESPALKSTVTDIRVLNLVNTLYLTPAQAHTLMGLERQAMDQYSVLETRRSALAQRAVPVLRQMRDTLAANTPIDPEIFTQLDAIEKDRRALTIEEAKLDATNLTALKDVVNDNQVMMIANFVPCTVPVQSLTNPERVGQANDNTGLERALGGLRTLPEARLPKAEERLKTGITNAFKRKHYRDEAIAAVTEKVHGIVLDARAMDDAEFKLKVCEMAKELAVPDHIAAGKELDGRIVSYLLSPNLLPILEARFAGK